MKTRTIATGNGNVTLRVEAPRWSASIPLREGETPQQAVERHIAEERQKAEEATRRAWQWQLVLHHLEERQ